jgi:hypothetical protein
VDTTVTCADQEFIIRTSEFFTRFSKNVRVVKLDGADIKKLVFSSFIFLLRTYLCKSVPKIQFHIFSIHIARVAVINEAKS